MSTHVAPMNIGHRDHAARVGPGSVSDCSHTAAGVGMPDEQSFDLDPLAPFSLDLTAWALRRRSHNEVDRWGAAGYQRVITVEDRPVAVSVTQDGGLDSPRLSVQLAGRPIDQRVEVLVYGALRKLLGLTVDLTEFAAMAKQDALLGPLAGRLRGLKPPRFPTVFEALVNAVACQQLSLTVGIHLLNRITAAYGSPVEQSPQGPRAFPTPEQLAALEPADLQHHGFSLTKGRTIVDTARAIVVGDLDLGALERLDDRAAIERLESLRGVGRWSAEYVLLRGLGRLHVFPGDDVGAHNKLRRFFDMESKLDHAAVGELVARWHPYQGMVYFHLLLQALFEDGVV
jgi:DNA-3-methyladenine glycosylase II